MASPRLSVVVALEIATARATSRADRRAAPDYGYGLGESDVGRRTDRGRTAGEARDPSVTTDGEMLHADVRWCASDCGAISAVEHLRPHSRDGGFGVCDFSVVISATFRVLYVFVVLDVGTRRIRHWNVTEHPTAGWTAQQFRMVMSADEPHRFLIHDHDSIYSDEVDRTITAMGLTILKTPVRTPQANAFCE